MSLCSVGSLYRGFLYHYGLGGDVLMGEGSMRGGVFCWWGVIPDRNMLCNCIQCSCICIYHILASF